MTRRTFTVIDIVEILIHWQCRPEEGRGGQKPRGGPGDRGQVHRQGRGRGLRARRRAALGGAVGRHSSTGGSPSWSTPGPQPHPRHDRRPIGPTSKRCSRPTRPRPCTSACVTSTGSTSASPASALCLAGVPRGEPAQHRHAAAPDVPPGEEAQIDYGYLGTWFDPLTERMRRVWAFVMVLA